MMEASFPLRRPLDLRLTMAPLRHGAADPSMVVGPGGVWRATRNADGATTIFLRVEGTTLVVGAWGPGAARALDQVPTLVGQHDDDSGFRPGHPVVVELARRLRGLRMPRSGAVVEALVPNVLAQKVTAGEATRSYAALVRALGEPAPGPRGSHPLILPPTPEHLAGTPSYRFHRFGVERRRAETVIRACRFAPRMEEATTLAPAEADRRLRSIAGIGPWTAAKVALAAFGDADAVCTGDFHLPNQVAWVLAGEARADDARMLELLEPYLGHRARVQRLIAAGGIRAPRFGPRLAPARLETATVHHRGRPRR